MNIEQRKAIAVKALLIDFYQDVANRVIRDNFQAQDLVDEYAKKVVVDMEQIEREYEYAR
jgi:hypothetical protein